jgi:glycosyltransferase involved in cell wall biosynthesis
MKVSKTKNSIAIIGSRGIPNNYGGFECFTENISHKLVENGHDVYVSCEHPETKDFPDTFKGVELFYFPIKHPKSAMLGMFYEVFYDVYSLLWASLRVDQIYILGYSAALFFFIPKLFGKKLYLNPDGFEWKRNKFDGFVKFLLKVNERMGSFWADRIIADSKGIKKYYDKKYNMNAAFIAYGVNEMPKIEWDENKLPENFKEKVTINPSYWLVVARLEPENNIHTIVEGYVKSDTKKPLVIVGNFLSADYEKSIRDIIDGAPEDKKVVLTGGIYNQTALNMLRQNCFGYFHGHSVGGTNPSLIEAMVMKNVILAHDNQFNNEVCDDTAIYFEGPEDLKLKIDNLDKNPENYLELKSKALTRVKKEYSWDKIVGQYTELFDQIDNRVHYSPAKTPLRYADNSK